MSHSLSIKPQFFHFLSLLLSASATAAITTKLYFSEAKKPSRAFMW